MLCEFTQKQRKLKKYNEEKSVEGSKESRTGSGVEMWVPLGVAVVRYTLLFFLSVSLSPIIPFFLVN